MLENHFFIPFQEQGSVLKTNRKLPHWEQAGATYFVTFRTADSLPAIQRRVWEEERRLWLGGHPLPWSEETRRLYHRLFEGRLQQWLDRNHGSCPFRQPENARIVAESMRSFDTVRYMLDEFVVMPNHVHALIKPLAGFDVSTILHSWKSFTALGINRRLGRTGRLWMDESFDHIVRSWGSLEGFRRYIAENPIKARLRVGEYVHGRGAGLICGGAQSGK